MGTDPRQLLSPSAAEDLVVVSRAQFDRLRAGWTWLGAGTALGTAGGVLHNSWLLAASAIAFAATMRLNVLTRRRQEIRESYGFRARVGARAR